MVRRLFPLRPLAPIRADSRFYRVRMAIVACECGPGGAAKTPLGMGKDVLGGKAGEVEPHPVGEEPKAGRR